MSSQKESKELHDATIVCAIDYETSNELSQSNDYRESTKKSVGGGKANI